MIEEILNMNGHGLYVFSAFFFTLISFTTLYMITKFQFIKEKNKFVTKFGALDSKKADLARLQTINKEILSSNQSI